MVDLLRAHALFGKLPPRSLEQLGSYVTTRRVRKGTTIFVKGDPGAALIAVLKGTVKITVPAADGRETVLNLIRPGELFGEIALLDGQPRTADASAAEDCELMVIERRDFLPFMRSEPDVAVKLIEVLCARLRRTSAQVEDVTFHDLPTRLAKALVDLAERGKVDGQPARIKITQRELGQMIGMSRESTNKQLRAWEKRKWVALERAALTVLNLRALTALSEEDAD